MGYLHEGHLSLMRMAKQEADLLVVSVFVNPTQFGPGEDLKEYPRDLEGDTAACEKEGVDYLFLPPVREIYTLDASVYVAESALTTGLCGISRPGHFSGVLTIVAKLFNLVCPDVAVFGQKDAQQLRVIQQMVVDLNYSVRVLSAPIVREEDGVAMSSRNARLNPEMRTHAPCLWRALKAAELAYKQGITSTQVIIDEMKNQLEPIPGIRVDYIEIVDWKTLKPIQVIEEKTLVALAVFVGDVRLIDNTMLGTA